ncbi:MAG: FTR1 family protein [Armatimonadetes bacterium]|nr:FTR1 family protein [Armatimonadota bacterium]
MSVSAAPSHHRSRFYKPAVVKWAALLGALAVLAVLVWQALALAGAPDPTRGRLSAATVSMSSAVLVLREGLEAVLVLAAVTAGIVRNKKEQWRAVLAGAAAALLATVATWFIVIAVISTVNAPALAVQAGTGLLAIVVLLVIMNWFFHKVYWTGWICHHCKRRKAIEAVSTTAGKAFIGFALLGFTAIYREGFEIVLFLQDLRLKAGSGIVLTGAGIGFVLTLIVAGLTFLAHQRLPYKKMLVLTGVMLAVVLFVMVGESAQEMQLAGWLPTHHLSLRIPDWIGTWLATFPTAEGLAAQGLALALVAGSYAYIRLSARKQPCPA